MKPLLLTALILTQLASGNFIIGIDDIEYTMNWHVLNNGLKALEVKGSDECYWLYEVDGVLEKSECVEFTINEI